MSEALVAQIEAARRQRWPGAKITKGVPMSLAKGVRILRRRRQAWLRHLVPLPPAWLYERSRPGELLHLDVSPVGWIRPVGHHIIDLSASRA